MADYKELYLQMMRAVEKSVRILIQAQQECEEAILQDSETEKLFLFPCEEMSQEDL